MSDEIKNNIPEEEDNIVELTDEDGTVTKFEYLTTVPYEGEEYVVLMVLDENGQAPEEEDGEVVILQIAQDDAGEDIYVSVDDDDVTQKVFDLFLEAMARWCKHGRLRWLGGLTERHLGYGSDFMDEEKDTRARAFAAETNY